MKNTLPLEKELAVLTKKTPQMVYNPSAESLSDWQNKARVKLRELIGLDTFEKCDDSFTVEFKKEHDDFNEMRFVFQSEDGYDVPCHLLIPRKKADVKPPVMICLQGHSTGMHISLGRTKFPTDEKSILGDRDFAIQSVKRGLCAITLEQRCFGEKGGNPNPDCSSSSMVALLNGRTIIGGRVWDIMRLIDVIEKHFPDICDTQKIYCMGNSGGGTVIFYAAALDDRLKASMPSCAFCTFADSIGAQRHCDCNYIPHIAQYFDMAELAGMIAPRPIVVVSGISDGIFPIDGAKYEFNRLKNIYYSASENPDNCVHVIGSEGHRFYAEQAWAALAEVTKE